ncbi:MAG: phosphate ABC transporter substrate-binding protein PstS [Rhodomicrobium sp.]
METWFRALAIAACLTVAAPTYAGETVGAGSTFVYPLLAKWAAGYEAKTGNHVSYQSIGSGGGIAQIKAAAVAFGASDMPMKPDELEKLGMGQFPLVVGGVVPIVNLDGVQPGQMHFTGELLAEIFLGNVKNWNDPAIVKLNPGVALPDSAITVAHRADGSGTTFNWVNYLSKMSAEWRDKVGEATAVDWPVGIGGRGNEGVAAFVAQTKGSIGYVEYAYVLQNKMAYGLVQNKAGQFVKPSAQAFQNAASSADWAATKDFYLVMTDAPGEQSYPITSATFIIIYKQPKDLVQTTVAMDFFKWALEHGREQAESLDYAPLPPDLVQRIQAYWKAQFSFYKG